MMSARTFERTYLRRRAARRGCQPLTLALPSVNTRWSHDAHLRCSAFSRLDRRPTCRSVLIATAAKLWLRSPSVAQEPRSAEVRSRDTSNQVTDGAKNAVLSLALSFVLKLYEELRTSQWEWTISSIVAQTASTHTHNGT